MTPRATPTKRTTAKKDPVDRMVQEIAAGRADARLADVAAAIGARLVETADKFAWRFTLDDLSVGELELNLVEWELIETATGGIPIAAMSPEGNIHHLLSIARVLLAERCAMTPDEIRARLADLSAEDVPKLITRDQVAAPLGTPGPPGT